MNILKFLFTCFLGLVVVGCATKDYSPESFKGYTAAQILASGEKSLKKGNFSESTKYFEAIDALYPFDPEAKQGQLDAIYAYYKAGDYASTLAAADRYIHLYPEGEHTDYAYYMKGLANYEKNRSWTQRLYQKKLEEVDLSGLREAFVDFSDLVKLFPKSSYAPDARQRMLRIRDLLAERELDIAKFYYDRKAYVAAANRADFIVKHLEGAPQVADALRIMIKSYRNLGVDKQADNALRVFKLNFPREQI